MLIAFIGDPVATPRIKDPALAGLHVCALIGTIKHHARVRDYRHVYPDSRVPVIIEIDVLRDLCPGRQFHQSGTPENRVKTCHDLSDVRAGLQVRRLEHRALEVVIVATLSRNQRNSGVASQARGMAHPGRFGQRRDLFGQAFGFKGERQSYEGLGDLQVEPRSMAQFSIVAYPGCQQIKYWVTVTRSLPIQEPPT